jgi:hypothetical protein
LFAFAECAALMVVISSNDNLELQHLSCNMRLFIGRLLACKIQDMSRMLQLKNLHTRKGAAPIPCFSAQFAAATRDASQCGANGSAQNLIIGWEAYMCCDCFVYSLVQFYVVANEHLLISSSWYDMHNLHVLLILKIPGLCFRHVIFAAHC